MSFKTHKPGEWVQPVMKGYLVACCFCGLVHRLNFRIGVDKQGREQIQYQAFRAVKATRELRARTKKAK